MAAMARAAIDPMAGTFMAADEDEAVADLMAEEAWLAMELMPEAAELMMELTVGLMEVVWAEAEAARARAAATNLFICSVGELCVAGWMALFIVDHTLGAF